MKAKRLKRLEISHIEERPVKPFETITIKGQHSSKGLPPQSKLTRKVDSTLILDQTQKDLSDLNYSKISVQLVESFVGEDPVL